MDDGRQGHSVAARISSSLALSREGGRSNPNISYEYPSLCLALRSVGQICIAIALIQTLLLAMLQCQYVI